MSAHDSTVSFLPMHYDGRLIRTSVDERGFPWWVAQDICDYLGLGNVSQAVTRLQPNEKKTVTNYDTSQLGLKIVLVNEPGMYRLVFRSNKPEALAFQNWVYWDVLPTLRRGHLPEGFTEFPDKAQKTREPIRDTDNIARILERLDARLTALETPLQPLQSEAQMSFTDSLPPPTPRIKEHAAISLHLVAVWRALRSAETTLSNKEIARQIGCALRTATYHTRYLNQLGFLDVYETFPCLLYAITQDAMVQQSAYWQRLQRISDIFEARHRLTYDELQLLGKTDRGHRS